MGVEHTIASSTTPKRWIVFFVLVPCETKMHGAIYSLSFRDFFEAYPSLGMRRKEVRLRLRKVVRRTPGATLDLDTLSIHFEGDVDRETVRAGVEDVLEEIANRPYTAGEVRERLGITNQERLRWTKDGRLKRGGNEIIHRGQNISVTTYDVAATDDLARSPETLERWRVADQDR